MPLFTFSPAFFASVVSGFTPIDNITISKGILFPEFSSISFSEKLFTPSAKINSIPFALISFCAKQAIS